MKTDTDPVRRGGAPGGTMESLRRIERAQQSLWLLGLVLLLLITFGLLLLDAASVRVESFLSSMTARLADLLNSYGTSAALLAMVLLVCAYFCEKLSVARNQNRELVRALDTSSRIMAQRSQQLDTWSQLSHGPITKFNLPRLLDLIVHTAAEVTQSDCAAVMLSDDKSAHLRLAAIYQRGLQMELARRAAVMAIETGKQIYLRPEALPEELDRPDLAWEGLVSLAAAPLAAGGSIVGALLVGRLKPQEPFSKQIVEALDSFASQASIALEKAYLYAENQRQLDQQAKLLEDLRSTQCQLMRSERVTDLSTLAAGAAYAINNPLAAIISHSNSALEPKDVDESAVREQVLAIRRRALGMGEILKAFLDISRAAESEPMHGLDLNEIVRQALDLLRQEFLASDIEITECYDDLPSISGDYLQLQQVCLNLLVHASQILRGGGRLGIRTALFDTGWISLRIETRIEETDSATPGDGVVALGATPVMLSEMDPGLAAVARMIHSHGARIEVEGEPGAPTGFELWLQASTPDSDRRTGDQEPAGAAGKPAAHS